MDSNSVNILVEAKKEYLLQMYLVMCPTMIEVFEEMYKEAIKVSKGRKVLIQYQKFLKEVVNWNDHMIHKHSDTICSSCSWFNDLLAAVFVSSVKILSAVRLNADSNKISIKLPNNKVFIHGCFITAAKDLYKNPYVYHDESVEQERDTELTRRFSKCIEETVKELIPVQDILKSCISQAAKEDTIDFDNTMPDDSEDPEELMEDEDENEEPMEMEEEVKPEETPNVSEVCEEPIDEMKNIDLDKKSEQVKQEIEEEETLFDDAPEGKK